MTDIIEKVRQFTEAVGCTTNHYNVRQTALYIGLQLEEMAEKLEAMGFRADEMREYSAQFKSGEYDSLVERADRAFMLDADIDLAWVTIGSAFSQGADVEGAAGEVARANLSKLVRCKCTNKWPLNFDGAQDKDCTECNGRGLVAIKDENGKVKKPEGWMAPNIEPFVCKEGGEE